MNFSFPTLTLDFYRSASPVLLLCAGGIVAMMQGVFRRIGGEAAVMATIMAALLGGLVVNSLAPAGSAVSYLGGAYIAGDLGRFGQSLILGIAAVVALLFRETWLREHFYKGEMAALYLMIVSGMMVMVASEDIITMFVGIELSSIGIYAIIGYLNPTRRTQEGAIKYFILGAFASALLLFGFALLYASTGSMQLAEIIDAAPRLVNHPWMQVGAIFTIAGLGFKLALAPFHLWAPDAYEAAPTGLTAFMATSVKVTILILTLRLFAGGLSPLYEVWLPGLMFLAIASMILANIMALVQSSLKRMLAYSSVAHSGYMAVAICAISGSTSDLPIAAVLFYVVSYTLISIGAFAVLMWLENARNDNIMLEDIAGLAKTHPLAAATMATLMFAFAGMPPTAGFMAKFFVFNAALANQLYGIVIVGVIGSSISMYYYLRVIVRMYMTEPVRTATPLTPKTGFGAIPMVLAGSVVGTLLIGTALAGPLMRALTLTSQELSSSPLDGGGQTDAGGVVPPAAAPGH